MSNIEKGKYGEKLASQYLIKNGYRIIETNYKYSRLGEIDIIALYKDELCFVEVKTRSSNKFGAPFEAITRDKLQKMIVCMKNYSQNSNLKFKRCRIDAISVEIGGKSPVIKHIKNVEL
ncbi:MAG: YraN family protein [Candidatus Gastranaerophilales bacterium]|nr:YraN family protein [Candidatus Gastranaerophilales bacterium]